MPAKKTTTKSRAQSAKPRRATTVRTRSERASRGPIERAGRWLGSTAGRYLGQVLGTGDYVMPDGRNVLAPEPPQMIRDPDGIVITHREYLGDIITSSTPGAFNIQSFGINPGNPNTFPWLSTVCRESFQQYKFEQLMFDFRTFSADALNSTNTALGAVFSCINYDYSDPDVASRYEVENTDWAKSCKPSESMIIPVECDPKQTGLNKGMLYVLGSNNVPTGADPKTYFLGKMFIGTVGAQGADVNVGSLYVSYRIKIYKPIMTRPLSSANTFMQQRSGCLVAGNVHYGSATVASESDHDTLGVTLNGNVLTVDKKRLIVGQRYILSHVWRGGGAVWVPPTITLSSNTTGLNYFNNFTGTVDIAPQSGLGGTTVGYQAVAFSVSDSNNDVTCTLTVGTIPAAACTIDIRLEQINGVPPDQIGNFEP